MLKKDWLALGDDARQRGFTIAGVAQLSVIQETLDALDKAVSEGETLADFKARIGAKLTQEWGGANPRRLALIYQNGIQHAYNAGRYKVATDPEVLEARPFWQYDAILDNRTTPVCRAADGTILANDDPWWASHYPPLHHACRSSVRSLSASSARRQGITDPADLTTHEAGLGFGHLPDVEPWTPDPEDFATELFEVFQKVSVAPPVTGAEMRARLAQVSKDYADRLTTLQVEERATRDAYMKAISDDLVTDDEYKRLGDVWQAKANELEAYQKTTLKPDYADVMAAPEAGEYRAAYAKALPQQKRDEARAATDWLNKVVGKVPGHSPDGLQVGFYPDPKRSAPRSYCIDRRMWQKYYQGSSSKQKAGVYMAPRAGTDVAVHELGHWLEGESDAIHAAALKFLDRRRGTEKLKWVGSGRKTEMAWHDQFLSAYMGKDYTYQADRYASEIVSMGLQMMYTDPLALATKDPDYFDAIWHMIRGLPYD